MLCFLAPCPIVSCKSQPFIESKSHSTESKIIITSADCNYGRHIETVLNRTSSVSPIFKLGVLLSEVNDRLEYLKKLSSKSSIQDNEVARLELRLMDINGLLKKVSKKNWSICVVGWGENCDIGPENPDNNISQFDKIILKDDSDNVYYYPLVSRLVCQRDHSSEFKNFQEKISDSNFAETLSDLPKLCSNLDEAVQSCIDNTSFYTIPNRERADSFSASEDVLGYSYWHLLAIGLAGIFLYFLYIYYNKDLPESPESLESPASVDTFCYPDMCPASVDTFRYPDMCSASVDTFCYPDMCPASVDTFCYPDMCSASVDTFCYPDMCSASVDNFFELRNMCSAEYPFC